MKLHLHLLKETGGKFQPGRGVGLSAEEAKIKLTSRGRLTIWWEEGQVRVEGFYWESESYRRGRSNSDSSLHSFDYFNHHSNSRRQALQTLFFKSHLSSKYRLPYLWKFLCRVLAPRVVCSIPSPGLHLHLPDSVLGIVVQRGCDPSLAFRVFGWGKNNPKHTVPLLHCEVWAWRSWDLKDDWMFARWPCWLWERHLSL